MKRISFLILVITTVHVYAQNANSYISKGNQYYKQTQYSLAEAEYRKALQEDPKNTTAQYNLANALQKQKKYDEAVQILEKLNTIATDEKLKSDAAYNQGVAYTKQQALVPSIEAYKKALRFNPNNQQARENLQKALSELKKKQEEEEKQKKQKPQSTMSDKEAEQKLQLLLEKEKQLQQRLQNQNPKSGGGKPSKDW